MFRQAQKRVEIDKDKGKKGPDVVTYSSNTSTLIHHYSDSRVKLRIASRLSGLCYYNPWDSTAILDTNPKRANQ